MTEKSGLGQRGVSPCDHNPQMLYGHVVVRHGKAFCLRCRRWFPW